MSKKKKNTCIKQPMHIVHSSACYIYFEPKTITWGLQNGVHNGTLFWHQSFPHNNQTRVPNNQDEPYYIYSSAFKSRLCSCEVERRTCTTQGLSVYTCAFVGFPFSRVAILVVQPQNLVDFDITILNQHCSHGMKVNLGKHWKEFIPEKKPTHACSFESTSHSLWTRNHHMGVHKWGWEMVVNACNHFKGLWWL